MENVIFTFKGINTIIQCNKEDKMKFICNKFINKVRINMNSIYFLYNGMLLNYELAFNQLINKIDKDRNEINILVFEKKENTTIINEGIIKSKEIICPKCKEKCKIKMNDYKIKLYDCKKNHEINNILLDEYNSTQNINELNIKCDICNNINKNSSYNKQFYICLICKKNICPLCKSLHDKNHKIIDYDFNNYICNNHNEKYISYCNKCKKNICFQCEINHNNHEIIKFINILPDVNKIKEKIKEFKSKIDKLNNKINNIIIILNKVMKNFEIYYNINYDIINNYIIENRNYELLNNINEIENNIKIKDIDKIININNINNEFKTILNIYNKMENKNNENNNTNKSFCNKNDLIAKQNDQIKEEGKFIKFRKKLNNEKEDNKSKISVNNNNVVEIGNSTISLSSVHSHSNFECKEKNTNKENQKLKFMVDEYNELIKNYPKKEDGIKVEKRDPIENTEKKTIYYGEWDIDKNIRHGRGVQIWPDGTKYIGYWENDKVCGKGKLFHSDGDIYEGDWLNDKSNGFGIYIHKDGTRFEGEWKNDKQNGYGKEIWTDGAIYEGQYADGKKNGKGKYCWADGSIYEGDFSNNNIHGEGTYLFADKRKYIGAWANNKMNGKGVFIWADGRKYEGEYKNDIKEGFGEFEWVDGKKYRGYWKNGKQDGEGEFYFPSNQKWKKGIWKEGQRIKWIE